MKAMSWKIKRCSKDLLKAAISELWQKVDEIKEREDKTR